MKECFLDEAVGVCGGTQGIARQKETRWWNEEVAALVKEKLRSFNLWKGPRKCKKGCRCGKAGGRKLCGRGRKAGNEGWWCMDMETRRQTTTRQGVKIRELFSRQKMMRERGFARTWREDEKGNLLGVAKQLLNKNRDGKIVVEEDRLMEVWRAHYDVLSNEKFTWDREGLTDASPVCGPSERIDIGGGCGYW